MNKSTVLDDIVDLRDHIEWYKVDEHEHANCEIGVLRYVNDQWNCTKIIMLKSYRTIVCGYVVNDIDSNDHSVDLFITGIYSRTTIKHIGWFARLCTPFTYYMFKDVLLKHDGYLQLDEDHSFEFLFDLENDYMVPWYIKE